jgi:outer membrane protein assembly factor BamE (lipoprotein component of BamABCDE complex)
MTSLNEIRLRETPFLRGAAASVLAAALLCGSCVLALKPQKLLAGRPFPAVRLAELHTGMPSAEVRTIIGEPLSRRAGREAETWRYESLYQLRACQLRLLFIPIAPSAKERRTATLFFRDDRLLSVTLETKGGFGEQGVRHFGQAARELPERSPAPTTLPRR